MKKKIISIITPVYNEINNLENYFNEIEEKLLSIKNYKFEIILIDDGSSDESWDKISEICKNNKSFRGIRLSRNFGSHIAITAGLDRAKGDAAIILACDLQDPVETAIEFLEKWEDGFELVWGERITRKDVFWKILTSKIFNLILKKYVLPKNSKFTSGSFLLMDRKVVNCFNLFKDNSRLTFALAAWTGFNQTIVKYNRQSRKAGKSGWKISNMLSSFYSVVIAFSTFPLKIISVISIISVLSSIPVIVYIFLLFFSGRTGNIGWVSNTLLILFFSGIILFSLSIIGIYLSRIYKDASARPLYFVSSDTNKKEYLNSRPIK